MKEDIIDIMCPKCKSFLVKADKRDRNVRKIKCNCCGKWIWFIAKTNYFEIRNIPERTTSSGVRFY